MLGTQGLSLENIIKRLTKFNLSKLPMIILSPGLIKGWELSKMEESLVPLKMKGVKN